MDYIKTTLPFEINKIIAEDDFVTFRKEVRGIEAEPNIVAFTRTHTTGKAYRNRQALRIVTKQFAS